nr:MAG TPA: hypothetical protein [Caudoviricetes sp.]
MAEPISLDEAVDFISRLCAQSNAPTTPPNAVSLNAVGIPLTMDLSTLPPGTLIDSYVTGEFFKVTHDHWVTTRTPNGRYTDADVATQVRLGWDADLERTDFNLIHMGE